MGKKRCLWLLVAVFMLLAGCGHTPAQPVKDTQEDKIIYNLAYYYCVKEDGYVSEAIRKQLDQFGSSAWLRPGEETAVIETRIPEVANGAKLQGWISLVLPEEDPGKYIASPKKIAEADGTDLVTCYRTVGGMTTDERVNIYMDAEENIIKYETVNRGRYDDFLLDDAVLENIRTMFLRDVRKVPGLSNVECHAAEEGQTAYRIFKDIKGAVVVSTMIYVQQDGKPLEVELYAVVVCSKPLLGGQ